MSEHLTAGDLDRIETALKQRERTRKLFNLGSPDNFEQYTMTLLAEVRRLRALPDDPEAVERAAFAYLCMDQWPTNEELGGGPCGTMDDEFRAQEMDSMSTALRAALNPQEEA